MKLTIKANKKGGSAVDAVNKMIAQGRQTVIKHALGGATAAYQVYPVGKPHTDGTPHTRDTFQVLVNGVVIGSNGKFWTTTGLGYKVVEADTFVVSFRAAGASFFVEWGTIYMEARPILRVMVNQVRTNIMNELRTLNVSTAKGF